MFVIGGLRIARKRSPEIAVKKLSDNPMDIVFSLIEMDTKEVHLIFKRFRESKEEMFNKNNIFVSFFKPRVETPEKL